MQNSSKSEKVVGILGGMGPYATTMFMKNIMDLSNAKKDSDHVHLVVDCHPHLPSRTRSVLYNEESPVNGMVEAISKLQNYPVDIVVIPCNSACNWIQDLRRKVKVPVIDIVEIACLEFSRNFQVQRVAALGGPVVYKKQLYKKPLERNGFEYVDIPESYHEKIYSFIEKIKTRGSGAGLENDFLQFILSLKNELKFEGLILACTEFSAFNQTDLKLPFIDSNYALARFVVEYAKHGRAIPFNSDEVSQFWKKRAAMLDQSQVGLLQATMLTSAEVEAHAKWESEKNALLSQISHLLKPTESILEFGCGLGRWSRVLSQFVAHVDAFDSCDDFIVKARDINKSENISNVSFFTSDIDKLNISKTYDHTVSIALLHYLSEEDFLKAMRSIQQAVKPGGYAIFRESFGTDKRFELHGFYSEVLDTEYHAIYRTSQELASALGSDFNLIFENTNLAPTDKKPETCQKVVIFRNCRT